MVVSFDLRHVEIFLLSAPAKVIRPIVQTIFVEVKNNCSSEGRGAVESFTDGAMNLDVAEGSGAHVLEHMRRKLF